jgi:hypothetical protein
MKLHVWRCAAVLSVAGLVSFGLAQGRGGAGAGLPPAVAADQDDGPRLPNGKLQRDEILRAEHEQSLKDISKLIDVAEELKQELEKNDRFVVSMSSLKKTDEIEKLVKRIRSRLRRN